MTRRQALGSKLLSRQFLIFVLIGGLNTAIDLAIFLALFDYWHLPLLIANTISTLTALAVSYYLNSRFTFSGVRDRRTAVSFAVVTLAGLWVLQPVIISLGLLVLDRTAWLSQYHSAIAKLASVPFTLLWNYFWYHAVVFKDQK